MTITDLLTSFPGAARTEALQSLLATGGDRPTLTSVAGSAAPLMLAAIQSPHPIVVIASDMDDAGYIYFDLARAVGEEAIAVFPSGYKRDIKYGQVDAPAVVLRTETLRRVADPQAGVRFLVTYPEAIAEQVAAASDIAAGTISLHVGDRLDFVGLQQQLRDKGFKEVDYVYEPGHFAVRGSILDIFGYGSELPFRIDFFGDDVDSIRTFNIETQLSETRLDRVDIVSDVEAQAGTVK